MPVDPATLRGYRPPEPPRRERDGGLAAAIVAAVGTVVLAGFFLAARESDEGARAFAGLSAAAGFAAMLALAAIGWHEDGFWGMLYRVRHPLGTAAVGDDKAPWMWFAAAWLLVAAGVLSGVLMAVRPSAWPG